MIQFHTRGHIGAQEQMLHVEAHYFARRFAGVVRFLAAIFGSLCGRCKYLHLLWLSNTHVHIIHPRVIMSTPCREYIHFMVTFLHQEPIFMAGGDAMPVHVLRTLGQRIIAARLAHPQRLSQRELAKRIGLSQKSLNLIEKDVTRDPHSSIVCNVSRALGISTDWLLKGVEADERELEPTTGALA